MVWVIVGVISPKLVYVLTRNAFDDLRQRSLETAHIQIKNLTLNLSVPLRHTNRLAMARGTGA